MKDARAGNHDDHEYDTNPWIEGPGYRGKHASFAVGASDREGGTNEIKFES